MLNDIKNHQTISKIIILNKRNIYTMLDFNLSHLIEIYSQKKVPALVDDLKKLIKLALKSPRFKRIDKETFILRIKFFFDSFDFSEAYKYLRYILPSSIILLTSIAFGVFPLHYQDGVETWFGFLIGINRKESITHFLHIEILASWVLVFIYLFSSLFYPLGNSFLLSHKLWLRLTQCKPHQIILSKAIWVLAYAIFLSGLTAIWATLTAML